VLGRGIEVATPKTKSDEAQRQIGSLDIVLYFFSGIALFVGAFLILNAFTMTVFQRMREIGTLRALGASDRRVARSILVEAVLLAFAGSVVVWGWAPGSRCCSCRRCSRSACRCPVSTSRGAP
jgi:putative ABC transport system permease protein